MEEIEDNECMNCYREMDNYFEPFCCDECYDEWHEDNEDYEYNYELELYILKGFPIVLEPSKEVIHPLGKTLQNNEQNTK